MKIAFAILALTFTILTSVFATRKPIPQTVYKFQGKLNGKIPVFLWFVMKDKVVKGEVTYLKTAKRVPITVIGTVSADNVARILEFEKNGNITGIYEAKLDVAKFNGTWFSPTSRKELTCALSVKDTAITVSESILNPAPMTGSFRYQYGKDGATGGVDIKQTGGSALLGINCVTEGPAYNLADVETFKAPVVNNTITTKIPDGDCRFRLRSYNGFVVIDLLDDLMKCGFGMNASIEGVFLKINDVPKLEPAGGK